MKKLFLALVFALVPIVASAASLTGTWTLPLTAQDGTPLTGAQALTSVQVFIATAPIADSSTAAPTATLTASSTTTTQTVTAAAGQTLYLRVKACNSAGCSPFSVQASKVVPISVPGIPTSVTITINLE